MTNLQLIDVHNLASELFWKLELQGEIFPPSSVCASNDDCWSFIRERHLALNDKVGKLLAQIILDAKKPYMTIEEQFFVRERLAFAMYLSECIDPENPDMESRPHYAGDVEICIKGNSTGHFLMWLVDFVFFCLGDSELLCKANIIARKSRDLSLRNSSWLIMREDPSSPSS